MFEHNIPKCTSILQNETISKERFCGDKDDLLYCWSRGILKCCYNNIPCLELESTLAMTVDFVYDVIVAEAEYDEKEEEERRRRDEKRRTQGNYFNNHQIKLNLSFRDSNHI